jgi:hypothetical protein
MADLLLSFLTRSGADRLDRSLKMFLDTCNNVNNFDIQFIIDTDQIELYKRITDRYPNAHKTYVEHIDNSWLNIINGQLNFMKEHDYYFIWSVADDVFALENNWDTAIISKKKSFQDDLFILYTRSYLWGRSQSDLKTCYSGKDGTTYYESMPISTKKFCEFLSDIFKEPTKYIWGRECMIAELIRILYMKYGENRHVSCDAFYGDMTDNRSCEKMWFCWDELVKRNYDDLYIVAEKMKDYIDSQKIKQNV